MKINYYLIIGVMVTAGAVAQITNNPLPPVPPANSLPPIPGPAGTESIAAPAPVVPETNPPVKKPAPKHHKKAAKKSGAKAAAKKSESAKPVENESISLVPGTADVIAINLNVRGQAGLKGEVVAHLQKGDTVTVLSQINLDTHKADEPAQWAKIALPKGSSVWVRSSFISATDKTVQTKKLNLRGGPSEDFSILGVIERGTVVNEIGKKGEWSKIEAPTNAFGFVAAKYLKQENPVGLPPNTVPPGETGPVAEASTMPPTATTVPESAPIVNQVPPPAPPTTPTAGANGNLLPPPIGAENNPAPQAVPGMPPQPDVNTPAPPRIVTHEGYVRDSISIVAPTYYELYDVSSQKAIDYLHSTTTNLNLSRYNGYDIIVTGEEGLDARWKNTPVLTVQRIYVVSTNKPVVPVLKSPRASTIH